MKKRISIVSDKDWQGNNVLVVTNTNGASLTLEDIHNELVHTFGGGMYAVLINCNSGETVGKVTHAIIYDEFPVEGGE